MQKSNNTFISSTFWSERIGYAAGIATLKEMRRIRSWKVVKSKGRYIKNSLKKIAKKNGISIVFYGLDSLIRFELKEIKNINYIKIITNEMLKKKFLANNLIYVSVSHSKKLIDLYIKHMDKIFKKLSKQR